MYIAVSILIGNEVEKMIRCKGLECKQETCCIECSTKHNHCMCEIAEELNCDEELILQKCEYAESMKGEKE